MLKDLKDAGVIDAGALGFVYLIQGWLFVIANSFDGPKVISMNKNLEGLHNKVDTNQSVNDLLFQYCTEALIYDCDDTEENVKSNFDDKGDSLIVISDEGSLKLHIHTNSPNDIINQFAKFGKLKAAKIDDMKSQTLIAH